MAYKCRICGSNEVEHPDDVCELCAIGQDPYMAAMQSNGSHSGNGARDIFQNREKSTSGTYMPGRGKSRKVLIHGSASISDTDPYGNAISVRPEPEDPVQVCRAGQIPIVPVPSQSAAADRNGSSSGKSTAVKNNSAPLASGIARNIKSDTQRKSALERLFRTLFKGIPYTLDNDITMFQVFPDYTGTCLNALGNACDQVIVYGKLNAGAVSENNDVEVYGRRDSDNNIVARKIVNKASGATATPARAVPVPVIWGITVVVFTLLALFVGTYGTGGIVWAVILILCLMNLPLVFKIFAAIIGFIFSMLKRG